MQCKPHKNTSSSIPDDLDFLVNDALNLTPLDSPSPSYEPLSVCKNEKTRQKRVKKIEAAKSNNKKQTKSGRKNKRRLPKTCCTRGPASVVIHPAFKPRLRASDALFCAPDFSSIGAHPLLPVDLCKADDTRSYLQKDQHAELQNLHDICSVTQDGCFVLLEKMYTRYASVCKRMMSKPSNRRDGIASYYYRLKDEKLYRDWAYGFTRPAPIFDLISLIFKCDAKSFAKHFVAECKIINVLQDMSFYLPERLCPVHAIMFRYKWNGDAIFGRTFKELVCKRAIELKTPMLKLVEIIENHTTVCVANTFGTVLRMPGVACGCIHLIATLLFSPPRNEKWDGGCSSIRNSSSSSLCACR